MTKSAMKLVLRPERGGLLTMSLAGRISEETERRRRTLLGLAALWAQPRPLLVALSADESGSWAWSELWMEALADVAVGYELRFVERTNGRR